MNIIIIEHSFLGNTTRDLLLLGLLQGIYDGMALDEIKRMAPEEHKVMEEHPFNYRYPRGEVSGKPKIYLRIITVCESKFNMNHLYKFKFFMKLKNLIEFGNKPATMTFNPFYTRDRGFSFKRNWAASVGK